MKRIVIIFFLFFTTSLFAQRNIDYLAIFLKPDKINEEQDSIWTNFIWHYARIGKTDCIRISAQKLVQFSLEENDDFLQDMAFPQLGIYFSITGDYLSTKAN